MDFNEKFPLKLNEKKETKASGKEEKFHAKLDKLVHDTFGERPSEKKCTKEDSKESKKTKNKDVELNPEIDANLQS